MASRAFSTAIRVAAVGALGLALAAPTAHAQAPAPAGGLNVGSLLNVLNIPGLQTSVSGSVSDPSATTGSMGSLSGFFNQGSLTLGVQTLQGSSTGSAGSIGEAANTLDPAGFGNVVGGSLATMSSDTGTGSMGTLPAGSIENFFDALTKVKTN